MKGNIFDKLNAVDTRINRLNVKRKVTAAKYKNLATATSKAIAAKINAVEKVKKASRK